MGEDQNQNQQKQKGGNNNGPKMGITLGTAVSSVNNPQLGETIRGAVADGLGFTVGAIATGIFSFCINKIIKRIKPSASVTPVFPTPEDRAAAGPNARELMGQLHQLRNTNKDEAARIVESVGKALGMSFQDSTNQAPTVPSVEQTNPTPTPAVSQEATSSTAEQPKKESNKKASATK